MQQTKKQWKDMQKPVGTNSLDSSTSSLKLPLLFVSLPMGYGILYQCSSETIKASTCCAWFLACTMFLWRCLFICRGRQILNLSPTLDSCGPQFTRASSCFSVHAWLSRTSSTLPKIMRHSPTLLQSCFVSQQVSSFLNSSTKTKRKTC